MLDFHTHTFFSDGALIPSEHVRRVEQMGYQAIAITDHADSSNINILIPNLIRVAKDLNAVNRTRRGRADPRPPAVDCPPHP